MIMVSCLQDVTSLPQCKVMKWLVGIDDVCVKFGENPSIPSDECGRFVLAPVVTISRLSEDFRLVFLSPSLSSSSSSKFKLSNFFKDGKASGVQHLAVLTPSVESESVELLLSSGGSSLIVAAQPGCGWGLCAQRSGRRSLSKVPCDLKIWDEYSLIRAIQYLPVLISEMTK